MARHTRPLPRPATACHGRPRLRELARPARASGTGDQSPSALTFRHVLSPTTAPRVTPAFTAPSAAGKAVVPRACVCAQSALPASCSGKLKPTSVTPRMPRRRRPAVLGTWTQQLDLQVTCLKGKVQSVGPNCPRCHGRTPHSPLGDAFVCPDDGGLDVYRVVPHSPQLHGLVQGPHHVQGVVALCRGQEPRQSLRAAQAAHGKG